MKALGPKRDKSLWDRLVNDKFGGKAPVLSPDASIKAAKRLYRKAMGKPWKGGVTLTSGNRHTWVRSGTLIVNPDERRWNGQGGLREIIHSISHYAHMRLHPDDAPHSRRQAQLEGKLVTYAIQSGWLEPGALEPKPKAPAEAKPAPDIVQVRYGRIRARMKKWDADLAKAKKMLARAQREAREYERRHGDRLIAN